MEYWRKALVAGEYTCSIAMDLSNVIDCMPHGLLIAKLHTYGVSDSACCYDMGYVANRMQRGKIMGEKITGNSSIKVSTKGRYSALFCLIVLLIVYFISLWIV